MNRDITLPVMPSMRSTRNRVCTVLPISVLTLRRLSLHTHTKKQAVSKCIKSIGLVTPYVLIPGCIVCWAGSRVKRRLINSR